mmetsp:Transcript_93118/g.299740  ORF Transcript_93118/g.299740 Transcript_93118/m.299740 type:complete len:231 (+) Transcript_93118:218-910(+)
MRVRVLIQQLPNRPLLEIVHGGPIQQIPPKCPTLWTQELPRRAAADLERDLLVRVLDLRRQSLGPVQRRRHGDRRAAFAAAALAVGATLPVAAFALAATVLAASAAAALVASASVAAAPAAAAAAAADARRGAALHQRALAPQRRANRRPCAHDLHGAARPPQHTATPGHLLAGLPGPGRGGGHAGASSFARARIRVDVDRRADVLHWLHDGARWAPVSGLDQAWSNSTP